MRNTCGRRLQDRGAENPVSATSYDNENIFSILKKYARSDPDRNLITADNDSMTRGALVAEAGLFARALARSGVGHGTKVGLILPNSVLWYVVYWALASLGAIPVPFDPQAGEWELARLLSPADAQVCFAASRYRANDILKNLRAVAPELPGLRLVIAVDEHSLSVGNFGSLDGFLGSVQASDALIQVCEPGGDDPLMFACTSGSTGNPRIIVVPHRGFAKSQKDMADYLSFSESDSMLLGMPLYHQGGFGMGLQMAINGGRVIYQSMFDPEKFLSIIVKEKITVLQLTTTLAKILLSVPGFDPGRLTSVRLCYFAGEVLPVEIAREFFGKASIRVVNVIGSTETATMVAWDSEIDSDADSNEFLALPFTKVRVLGEKGSEVRDGETGSISIHTDALLSEYYKNDSETCVKLSTHDGL
jgi:acyl-CoA synthetase (AMP-forming)/AMP-acid ligase II